MRVPSGKSDVFGAYLRATFCARFLHCETVSHNTGNESGCYLWTDSGSSISPASSGSLGERETVVFAAYDAAKGTGEDGG